MGLFGKKNDTGDGDDANRSALFGGRSKKQPPQSGNPYAQQAPQSGNPYAQAPQSANPYAQAPPDPYTAAKQKAYSNPDPYSTGSNQHQGAQGGGNRYGGDTKTPAYTGTMAGGGYANHRYGNQAGYGADRYGTGGGQAQAGGSRYGAGGYGGLGGGSHTSEPDSAEKSALFGNAQERVHQKQQTPGGYGAPPPYDNGSHSGAYGGPPEGSSAGGYGGAGGYQPGPKYDDRQLTAEEEEEEEVNATKQQIRFLKQEDVASTRNALRIAQQAEEVGRDTLARLGAQGEHLHATHKNLDLAHNQNKIAEEKARELKTLNRSMWAVHVNFNSKSKEAKRDQEVIDKHLEERSRREATRREAYLADQRMQKNFNSLSQNDQAKREKNLAERAKYQFEADSEDDEMENEIDNNLDALAGVTGRLNQLARITGEEVDLQNKKLDEISRRGDQVDVGIAANRAKLDRIR